MNERIKQFEKTSGLEIYGLGLDRVKWNSVVEKFSEMIVDECCLRMLDMDDKTQGRHNYYKHAALEIKKHFRVEE